LAKAGIGEVFLARDTKLKRDVAIKVLPEIFARDPERVGRFQREAEALEAAHEKRDQTHAHRVYTEAEC
jgi:serine/threonine protein kinase